MQQFGPESSQTVWLASLAVIAYRPSLLESGSVPSVARASLAAITHKPDAIAPPTEHAKPAGSSGKTRLDEIEEPRFAPAGRRFEHGDAVEVSGAGTDEQPKPAHPFGEATAGAGLYFLLNALRALDAEWHQLGAVFLARLFTRFASYAGVAADDPILLWAHATEGENESEEIDSRLLRIWFLRVRRWCWRNARLTMREVVIRPGYVSLTRTDLDITMYLDLADVRIRRVGLDLDPGWLPWFGRVVRFHYRSRGDARG
jgi:hypothetical protein